MALVSGQLIEFSIDPYSKNDLAAAPQLELREGDLVLVIAAASKLYRGIEAGL